MSLQITAFMKCDSVKIFLPTKELIYQEPQYWALLAKEHTPCLRRDLGQLGNRVHNLTCKCERSLL